MPVQNSKVLIGIGSLTIKKPNGTQEHRDSLKDRTTRITKNISISSKKSKETHLSMETRKSQRALKVLKGITLSQICSSKVMTTNGSINLVLTVLETKKRNGCKMTVKWTIQIHSMSKIQT